MSGNPSTSSSGGMSTGGGAGGGSWGGGGTGGDQCMFTFEAVLGSPDPAQVAALNVGDVLPVVLLDSPPRVVVCHPSGAVVGGITQFAAQLRSCIQQGYSYEAELLAVRGGAIGVNVRPVD